jgi:hypothetical protein
MNKAWYKSEPQNNYKLLYLKEKYKKNVNMLYLQVCYFESALELKLINDVNINVDIKKIINIINNKKITLSYLEGLSNKRVYNYRARQLFTGEHPKDFGEWNNIQELMR